MTLSPNENIEFNAFYLGLRATDTKQVLQNLSWKIGRHTNADMTWISDQLLHFEEKSSSAIGDGVAIPHLKSTPLDKPFILVAKLETPIQFGDIDETPVDLICCVLSPAKDGPIHLQRLARVTRIFRDENILDQLRNATSEDEMRHILRIIERPNLMAA